MKNITLLEAYRLLKASDAVQLGGGELVRPVVGKLEADESNEWLRLDWAADGLTFNLVFEEGGNRTVQWDNENGVIILNPVGGPPIVLTLLRPVKMTLSEENAFLRAEVDRLSQLLSGC